MHTFDLLRSRPCACKHRGRRCGRDHLLCVVPYYICVALRQSYTQRTVPGKVGNIVSDLCMSLSRMSTHVHCKTGLTRDILVVYLSLELPSRFRSNACSHSKPTVGRTMSLMLDCVYAGGGGGMCGKTVVILSFRVNTDSVAATLRLGVLTPMYTATLRLGVLDVLSRTVHEKGKEKISYMREGGYG